MKPTAILRTKLFLGLGLSAALVSPLAIVVACGSTSEVTSAPPASTDEIAAQKSIAAAPATLPANASLSDRVLFELKEAVKDVAGTTPIADYLASNKPSLESPTGALKYEKILMPELKLALGLAASTKFDISDFTGLLTKLGLADGKFATSILQPAAKNYDGQKSDATTSWEAQIKFWNFVFNPASRYANLAKLLKTNGLIIDATLLNFDKVIATPLNKTSVVLDVRGNLIVGFGGKAIFNDLPPAPAEITPTQYQVRSADEIRKSITGEATSPQIDLGQLNNIFEVYTAIGYALKIKDDAYSPLAYFWRQRDWSGFARQLEQANYKANISFKLGSVVSPAPSATTSDFEAADLANAKLVAAMRSPDAAPRVELLAIDDWNDAFHPASIYGENMLTNSGFSKVGGNAGVLLANPIIEAAAEANSEYALRVLGLLAALSPTQYSAYDELLNGLNAGLKTVFARLDSTLQQAGGEAKFAPGDQINLWAPTFLETNITKANLRIANFFIKTFTKQFDKAKYIAPSTT